MNSSFIKKTPEDPEEKTLVKRGQAAPARPGKKENWDQSAPAKTEKKEKRVEIKKPAAAKKQTEGRHKPTVQKGGVKRVMRSRTKK
jgi:hypothetical protein